MGAPAIHRETVTIHKRWSWMPALTVEIECAPDLSPRIKLGLAVKVARETRLDLTGADLRGADLRGAVLRGAVLRDAVLRDADLRGADLRGADLRGADLTGADLTGADLRGADLRGADLTGADLRGADLTGADLRGADLRGAVLRDAVLRDADLRGADLRGADLRGDKIARLVGSAGRLDGYTFYGFRLQDGGFKIAAGCRWFTSDEFRQHVADSYPGTDKAAETLAIIDHLERVAAIGEPAAPALTAEAA